MKPTLNLRQVEAFYSVMQTGTVVGAARLMNITQPAVSRAIALLELRIGYQLFERRGRRLVPTPNGEALYREVESVYGSLDRIAQASQDIRYQRAGALRIATMPAPAQGLVPRAIARLVASRPGVSVFVQSMPSRQVAEVVSTRQFDIGVVEMPLSRPSIAIEPLDPAPTMAIIPAGHRLAVRRRIALKDLAGERLVLLSQHSFLRYKIDDALSKQGVEFQVAAETPNSLVACALVAAGIGIAIASRWTAESFLGPRVVVRPMTEKLTSETAIIFPEPGVRLPLAESFAQELRREVRQSLTAG